MMPSSRCSPFVSRILALVLGPVASFAACGSSSTGGFSADDGGARSFISSGNGSGGSGAAGPGAGSAQGSATCIVGTQGCLCDSTGGCAPGLTCSPQGGQSGLCCSGGNCGSLTPDASTQTTR
jgi:hypothetical protein